MITVNSGEMQNLTYRDMVDMVLNDFDNYLVLWENRVSKCNGVARGIPTAMRDDLKRYAKEVWDYEEEIMPYDERLDSLFTDAEKMIINGVDID